MTGERYDMPFFEDRLLIAPWRTNRVLADVPYSEIEDVEISGPAIVKTGGGFVGGGSGGTAAVEGIAIAAAPRHPGSTPAPSADTTPHRTTRGQAAAGTPSCLGETRRGGS